MKKAKKQPIPAMELDGKVIKVPLELINIGDPPDISFPKAVVAYFDILGFSEKKDGRDIEASLRDFHAPLLLAAEKYPHVRFSVFSDCAFIAAKIENADNLISAVRYAFTQWSADGILVRGGIAIGAYTEDRYFAKLFSLPLNNFISSIFSGSAVIKAVQLEGEGKGALLFTNDECAEFFWKEYTEPIFALGDQRILSWYSEKRSNYWFTGISFLRLLRFLSFNNNKEHPVAQKLINNLRYSFTTEHNELSFARTLMLALFSSAKLSPDVHATIIDIFHVVESDDILKDSIDIWQNKEEMQMLQVIADYDSSIPGFLNMDKNS